MSETDHIIDVTRENFQTVIETSRRVPVLVDFWADWCQPCRTLTPILTQLADEYQGRFVLAKINTEQQQEIAAQFNIRSIPVVKLVIEGQIVDEFMGALPEAQVRQFLDKHIPRESDGRLDEAQRAMQAGDFAAAADVLSAAAAADPANPRLPVALAQAQAAGGDTAAARATLEALPDEQRSQPEVEMLLNRLEFAAQLQGLPAPAELEARLARDAGDSEARHQLALQMIAGNRLEEGLDMLLDLMRRDRGYGDDAARATLIKVFAMLGEDPLVARYRGRMASLLY